MGGAEIAAYNLYLSLKKLNAESSVTLLARSDLNSSAAGSIAIRRPGEYLWRQDMGSWFGLRTAYPTSVLRTFHDFLLNQQPDVVFVQHFAHLGVEILREIKRTLPQAKLIVTLHEYLAICNRNGQMLKTGSNRLCYSESVEDCHRCFPEFTPEDFWLRKNYLKHHFSYVDHFVSPSNFLMDRYIAWGIDRSKISVIENGQETYMETKRPRQATGTRQVFGFFGQITEYKGVDILLKAIHLLPVDLRAKAMFEIHGANLDHQGQWLKDLINSLKDPLLEEGCLRWAGPYGRENVLSKMARVNWVVVPSIWWENSPMVIQEAFVCGKPVLCSNIGGMAEKVRDGIDGLHFEVSNPFDLAERISYIIRHPNLNEQLATSVRRPLSYDEAALKYLAV